MSMGTIKNDTIDGNLTTRKALVHLFRLAIPTAVSFCATTLSNTAAFAFIGSHTNELVQESHALGFSIGNILVLMVGLGLINGMDTLCPLAIGSGHPEYTFFHLIQAFAIATAAMIPLIPLILFSKELLILSKQDPVVAAGAGRYLLASFPALFFICIYEAVRKFLIYHQHMLTQVIVSLVSIPAQVFFLWIFVALLKLEAIGAGAARSVTWMLMSSVLLTLTFIKRESFAWSKYVHMNRTDTSVVAREDDAEQFPLPLESTEAECQCTTHTDENNETDPSDERRGSSEGPGESSNQNSIGIVIPRNHLNRSEEDADSTTQEEEQLPPETTDVVDPSSMVKSNLEIVAEQSSLSLSDYNNLAHSYKHWWSGIGFFLRIAIPSTFLCIFEWLSFEMQVIEAGNLDSTELAALSASQSLGSLIYFVSLSVGVTVTSQVGRCMGRLSPLDAKVLTRAGIIASFMIACPTACVVALCRSPFAKLFSSSVAIQNALRKNFLALALGVVLADSLHGIISGAVKALSLQWIGCLFDFIGLLGVMQTIGLVLAFHTPLRGQGFIVGTAIGLYVVVFCYLILLFCCVDWSTRAKYLLKKRRRSKLPPSVITLSSAL